MKKKTIKKNSTSHTSGESGSGLPETRASDVEKNISVEVKPKTQRRRFTAKYKLRILKEYENAERGEKGALLRREGLFSSQIVNWKKASEQSAMNALSKKRGPKSKVNPLQPKLTALEKEVARLKEKLRKANLILEIQGKFVGLLDANLDTEKTS